MKPCSKQSRARGLTLIEVLAAIAILSVVLSSLLVSRARTMRQSRFAQQKLDAVVVARNVVAEWIADPDSLDRPGQGEVAGGDRGGPRLAWVTEVLGVEDPLLRARAERVQVRFCKPGSPETPLLQVELLMPKRQEQQP